MHEILCPWFQYMNLLQFFFKEELALKVFIWERKNKDISVKTHTFARPLSMKSLHISWINQVHQQQVHQFLETVGQWLCDLFPRYKYLVRVLFSKYLLRESWTFDQGYCWQIIFANDDVSVVDKIFVHATPGLSLHSIHPLSHIHPFTWSTHRLSNYNCGFILF